MEGLPGLMSRLECGALSRDPVLAEMVRRLVHALHCDRIYLFGSKVRGDARVGSGYDLLAVVPESDLATHRRDLLAFRVLCRVGAAKDVVVYTREEFESRSPAPSLLPATAPGRGRLRVRGAEAGSGTRETS